VKTNSRRTSEFDPFEMSCASVADAVTLAQVRDSRLRGARRQVAASSRQLRLTLSARGAADESAFVGLCCWCAVAWRPRGAAGRGLGCRRSIVSVAARRSPSRRVGSQVRSGAIGRDSGCLTMRWRLCGRRLPRLRRC
jgi:hypothetical protein